MAAEIPCAQKIVLGAGAIDGWQFLSVDEEHIIALAPPLVLILENRHGHADEMAAPCCFHPDVISFAVEVFQVVHVAIGLPLIGRSLSGSGLTILSVEVEMVRDKRLAVGAVVDVEVESIGLDCALVRYRDAGVLLKRHRKETVERLVG